MNRGGARLARMAPGLTLAEAAAAVSGSPQVALAGLSPRGACAALAAEAARRLLWRIGRARPGLTDPRQFPTPQRPQPLGGGRRVRDAGARLMR